MRHFSSHGRGRVLPPWRATLSIPSVLGSTAIRLSDAGLPPVGLLRVRDVEVVPGRPAVAVRPHTTASQPIQSALWLTDDVVPGAAQVWSRLADRSPPPVCGPSC